MHATPFAISIPEPALADLRARLAAMRWPDEYAGAPWALGTDAAYLRELTRYWATAYDWRREERLLNRMPQFIAETGGLRIHYAHQRGIGPKPYPLIITHGWPGSFAEFRKLLPHLSDPTLFGADPEDAFDVVIPSLPGFGFSERPAAPGVNAFVTADIWAELMAGLGYERYGAQGGDLGAAVSTCLAYRYPDRVDGIHLNFLPGSFEAAHGEAQAPLTPQEQYFLAAKTAWAATEGAYAHLQGTKPQSLAYALNDSPAGLAAWIIEKFRCWSDCGGDLETVFSKDELLTNLSLYWLTETIGSSMRLYWEMRRQPLRFAAGERVRPPLGFAAFPKEISQPPREWIERVFDVAQWTEMPCGGHFAALEQPALLAADIRSFFRALRA